MGTSFCAPGGRASAAGECAPETRTNRAALAIRSPDVGLAFVLGAAVSAHAVARRKTTARARRATVIEIPPARLRRGAALAILFASASGKRRGPPADRRRINGAVHRPS